MTVEEALTLAILSALRSANVASGGVHDEPGPGTNLPYVHIRSIQAVDDGADCVEGFELFVDIDVWSNAPGKLQATQIAGAVRDALHEAALPVSDPFALLDIMHRDTSIDRTDGELTRARMSFEARLERV